MQPTLSAQTVLVADENLIVTDATEHICLGASRVVQTRSLDDLHGACLPDSIPGLDSAEAHDACRTILSGEPFPDGYIAYRKGIMVFEPEPERRVFVLSPRHDDGRVCGVICRISRTFLRHRQADVLTDEIYRSMVDNSMEFMFVVDQLGFHTYVSPMIRATMGEEPDNVYGMHMSEVVHPDDIERCQTVLGRIAGQDEPVTDIQYRLVLPDGALRHISVSGHRFRIGDGLRYSGIAKDVTETMDLRAQLQARQEALAALSNIVLTLSRQSRLDDALHSALAEILAFLRLENGGINVISSDGSEMIAGALIGTDRPKIPPHELLAHLDALCPLPGGVQIVRDIAVDERLSDAMRAGLRAVGVRGFVLARFQSMLGQHACMAMDIPADGALSVEQIEFLNLATGILGPAIENAVLQGEVADRANHLAMLERMALSINSGIDVRSIFTACQAGLRQLLECDETCLAIFGANEVADMYSIKGEGELTHDRKKLSSQQVQEFTAIRESHAYELPGKVHEYHHMQHKERPLDSGSVAVSPLIYKDTVIGLLKVWAGRDGAFGRKAVSILQAVAEHLSIAVANARLYEAEHARTLELEALGREMQHRVKNNLQSIAGLLSMSRDGEQSHRALDRCLGQVRAISTVHSLLTPRRVVSGIRLGKLLREVATAAVVAAGRNDDITIVTGGADSRLSSDTAVALGVIANELVSNSIEHGYADGRAGEIRITASIGATCITVEISDDGVGLPPGFELTPKARTGLGLVASLAEYGLHGQFSISRSEPGAVARIEF